MVSTRGFQNKSRDARSDYLHNTGHDEEYTLHGVQVHEGNIKKGSEMLRIVLSDCDPGSTISINYLFTGD